MNDEVDFSSARGLVQASIVPRTETYYLVTEEALEGITESSTQKDVLGLIASLVWGAFCSVIITMAALGNAPASPNQALSIYKYLFLALAILFTLGAAALHHKTRMRIKWVKGASVETQVYVGENDQAGGDG